MWFYTSLSFTIVFKEVANALIPIKLIFISLIIIKLTVMGSTRYQLLWEQGRLVMLVIPISTCSLLSYMILPPPLAVSMLHSLAMLDITLPRDSS